VPLHTAHQRRPLYRATPLKLDGPARAALAFALGKLPTATALPDLSAVTALAVAGDLPDGETRGGSEDDADATDGRQAVSSIGDLRPAATCVLTRRPHFTWRAVSGATRYDVYVIDTDANRIAGTSPAGVPGTEWTPPAPLPPDRTLLWEVHARNGGQQEIAVSAPARLRVLSGREAARLAEEVAAIDRAAPSVGAAALARAALYANAGLREAAQKTLQAAGKYPDPRALRARLTRALEIGPKSESVTGADTLHP
jgi:hypothetical protein